MSFWTLERTRDLLQCVADGRSAKATAAILTGKYECVTRNACISKAKREGVIFHSDHFVHRRGLPRGPRRHSRPRIIAAKRTKSVPKPPTPMASLSQADHDIPLEQRKQLLDLTATTCRWPCNDPDAADFYFCGAPEADLPEGRPYCARHSRLAYARRGQYQISPAERPRRRLWANKLNSGAAA